MIRHRLTVNLAALVAEARASLERAEAVEPERQIKAMRAAAYLEAQRIPMLRQARVAEAQARSEQMQLLKAWPETAELVWQVASQDHQLLVAVAVAVVLGVLRLHKEREGQVGAETVDQQEAQGRLTPEAEAAGDRERSQPVAGRVEQAAQA
jgi:hypothetical protein